jgi:hypothetical protein
VNHGSFADAGADVHVKTLLIVDERCVRNSAAELENFPTSQLKKMGEPACNILMHADLTTGIETLT